MSSNVTANATAAVSPLPSDLLSMMTAFLSISAMREWLKLFFMGGAFDSIRRLLSSVWRAIHESFWMTVAFDDEDSSYTWMLYWLSQQPAWKSARNVELTTRSYGLDKAEDSFDDDEPTRTTDRQMTYLPNPDTTYSMWYNRHYMRVSRNQSETPGYYYRRKERLTISILARDHAIMTELFMEARTAYKKAEEHLISIYVSDLSNCWRHITSRAKRPMNSIILDPGMKELLLNDARDFLSSQDWYSERGIPFRRGYLLFGVPGSGKTSMIHSIAGELGLDVYILTLSRSGMDDNALNELICDLPTRCVVLLEDIDAAFRHGISRNLPKRRQEPEKEKEKDESAKNEDTTNRVTLSGLLNALDGIGAQEGRILFATTNDYSALDPALCRPGRMDLHIEFKLSSKYQADALFKCFYMPSKDDNAEEDEKLSGSQSRASTEDVEASSETCPLLDGVPPSPTFSDTSGGSFSIHSHPKGTLLSAQKARELARQFADAIPDREFSMASLQGYLMMYKTRPYEAVRDAPAWVEKQREEIKAR